MFLKSFKYLQYVGNGLVSTRGKGPLLSEACVFPFGIQALWQNLGRISAGFEQTEWNKISDHSVKNRRLHN